MKKHFVCLTPYLRSRTSYDCDFWCTCVNNDISSNFFHFSKFWFLRFLGGQRAKNDLKLPISVCFALYLRNCGSYHQDFDKDMFRCFSLFLKKIYNIVNIKITCFLLACFNSFFNNYLHFKFINKCQKEILRCAPPSSHVCDFSYRYLAHYVVYTTGD